MAKKGYPGLVLVPPSDRSILKRRLARWAFLIISVIGGLSALNIWLPQPDRTRDCQTDAEVGTAPGFRENCRQPGPSVAETPPRQSQLVVSQLATTDASPHVAPVEVPSPTPVTSAPSPKRDRDQPEAQSKASEPSKAAPLNLAGNTSNRLPASPRGDESQTSRVAAPEPALKPTPADSHPDLRLAAQGDAFAQYRLGRFYAQQSGLRSPESASWYMKASDGLRRLASTGNGQAMYVLGVMYAFGRGVTQNREEARSWLAQAIAHEVPEARHVLVSLEKYRDPDSTSQANGQAKRRQT